jgi:hypothetical protein
LTKAVIRKRIAVLKADREAMVAKSGADVVRELWDTLRDAQAHDDRPSALRALELLGRHHGVFERDNEQRRHNFGMVIM